MTEIQEIVPNLENAGHPLEGVATAGQPEEKHLKRLAEAGYKTVVDLRTPEEDRASTSRRRLVRPAWST